MAEEVNYASVVFKNKRPKAEAEKKDEIVYDEVRIRSQTTEKRPDSNTIKNEEIVYDEVRIQGQTTEKHPDSNAGLLADKEAEKGCHNKTAYCFVTVCVILLLGIIGLLGGGFSHIASIHDNESQLKSNQTAQQEKIYSLNSVINNLTSENKNLTRNLRDVIGALNEFKILTKSRSLLKDEIKNLTAENEDLTYQNNKLETQKQELEEERTNLTGQILNLEAESIKFNTSRAHWSVDAYCPKKSIVRVCEPCENGWDHIQPRCYAVNDHQSAGQRNWEGAREDCRGKGSDLVVVADEKEKKTVSDKSWSSSGLNGYWIGLRAESEKWKWLDGSDLAETSWITGPATDGRCVISVQGEGWKSVMCDEKQRWICEKEALSV